MCINGIDGTVQPRMGPSCTSVTSGGEERTKKKKTCLVLKNVSISLKKVRLQM
jgi:hypothetical protein